MRSIRFVGVWLLAVLSLAMVLPLRAQAVCDLDDAQSYYTRGSQRMETEDWQGAVDDFTCLLELDADHYDALSSRSFALRELRLYDGALADANHAIEIDPDEASAYNSRAIIYDDLGDYDRALADYFKAIEFGGAQAYLYSNMGNLYAQIGRYDDAIDSYNQALDLSDGHPAALLGRGIVYEITGDIQAFADYRRWIDQMQTRTIPLGVADITGSPLSMELGWVYQVTIDLQAGQKLNVAAATSAGSELDPLTVLVAPDGTAVSGNDDGGVNLDSAFRYDVSETGTYMLVISHAGGGSYGEFRLLLLVNDQGVVAPVEQESVFATYNLVVDDLAVVFTTAGDRLNLRSGPGLTFDIINKLERDSVVTLLEGARKNDGYNWWRVRTTDGLEGWAAERVEEEQTLQPALLVGGMAQVTTTDGDTLRLRSGAGRTFDVLVQIEYGAVVELLEGPQIADDLSWWKIRTADGQEGWAVERVEDERTLSRYTGDE